MCVRVCVCACVCVCVCVGCCCRHINKIQLTRIWHAMLEDFIIKYWWGAMGMCITALPVFFEVGAAIQRGDSVGGRTQGRPLFFPSPLASICLRAFGRLSVCLTMLPPYLLPECMMTHGRSRLRLSPFYPQP
jgi:hypothetical protein